MSTYADGLDFSIRRASGTTIPKETLNKERCADWRTDFSSGEVEKSQEYWMYFKILRRNQAEYLPSSRAPGFNQCFPDSSFFLVAFVAKL